MAKIWALVSNFPIVTKTLPSVFVTKAKKEIFFVFFILLRRRYFVAKVIGMVIAFIELSRTYYKEIFLIFNSVKERNTRKLNN